MRKIFGQRLRSFTHALRGIAHLIRTQPNAQVHLAATLGVCAAGFAVGLGSSEWPWLVVAIALVWSAEAFNTALEELADTVHPQQHPGIGRAKDLAAGAVLVAALGATLIGVLVFLPHLAGR